MSVRVLPDFLINQIAAGEVVERPASVVKELVENSIDAGATVITVEIKQGGISYMRITDNGCGIESEDVRKAFLSHATSKINSADDLDNIGTLGFRGEALSSIAAISQVELITKEKDSLLGTRYQIEGGVEKRFEETGNISLLSLTKIAMALDVSGDIKNIFAEVPYKSIQEVMNEQK